MQKLHLSFDKPEKKKRKRDRAFSISEIELSILLHNPLTPNYHFASFQSLPPPQHFQLKMYRHFQLDYVYTAPCTQAERERAHSDQADRVRRPISIRFKRTFLLAYARKG